MSNILITTSGTSFMNTGAVGGPYLSLKYFYPVYDHRIDPTIHFSSATTPVSAGDHTSAVNPTGDIIYNLDSLSTSAYTMSPNQYLLWDSNQTGTSAAVATISDSTFDGTGYITLRNGVPLSNSISGTSIDFTYPTITINGYTTISGNNSVPTGYASSRDKFFRTTSYAAISSAANGQSRGLFKVRLNSQAGNFKFNKIALYATRFLADGSEDTSIEPVLFAVAMLNQPIIKSNDGFNISFFELDVELQFSTSANGNFSNVSFLNNTEWNYVPSDQSLWFDGKVAISTSGIPNSWIPRAKLHITEHNPAIPMVRISTSADYIDEFFSTTDFKTTQTYKSSKASSDTIFQTSGSTEYAKITLNPAANATKSREIATYYEGSVSGAHQSGFFFEYGGYLENAHIYVDNTYLATFRGKESNAYGTLVLGKASDTLFEHEGKFLTLHGGALLVGSSLVSGSLSGGDLLPNTITCDGLITTNSGVIAVGGFATGVIVGTGTGGTIHGRNLTITTSAHFAGPQTFTGTISGNNTITANILYAKSDILGDEDIDISYNIRSIGGVISGPELTINTSAHFGGPVTVGSTVSAAGQITGSNLVAIGNLTVAGTGTLSDLIVNDEMDVYGFATFLGNIYAAGNTNVSGLAAYAGNLYMDNGDIHLRKKGTGIKANFTTVAASTNTATFSNNELFGVVTGWNSTTYNTLTISTGGCGVGDIVMLSIRSSNTAVSQFYTDTITGGSFQVKAATGNSTVDVHWFIIKASS